MSIPARRPQSPFAALLVACALLYGGWYVTESYMQWYAWGLGAMGLGFAVLIKALLLFIGSSFHTAQQIDMLRESRKLSYASGHARLALKDDPFVKALAANRRGIFLGAIEGLPLFYDPFAPKNGHMLCYAPSRTSKTTSFVIPALLFWFGGSVVVTDTKAELTDKSVARRRAMGGRVLLLDPFGASGLPCARFNPLRVLVDDILKNQGKELSTLSRMIAYQLIAEPARDVGDGRFFRSGARRLLITFLLYMVAFTPGECSLPTLRRHIWSSSEDKFAATQKMRGAS